MAEHDVRAARMPDLQKLARLSPEELAQAMEQALDQMTEDTYDQAVMDAYLDALDAKTPMPEATNVDASYQQFQAMLSRAVPAQGPTRPKRRSNVFRITLRVFLAAAFLFSCLLVAQAGGVDVLGAVARWTDETFHFKVQEDQTTSDWYVPYQEQLESAGLDAAWIPTWIPDGYTVGEIDVDELTTWTDYYIPLNNSDGATIHFFITIYTDPADIGNPIFEKDDRPVQEYQTNGKTVYLFHNLDLMTAVCQDENVLYTLSGDLSEDMVLRFFSGIGSHI